MKDPKSIVLTGASGGLGLALAAGLAAPGRRLLLLGRDSERLMQATQAVAARGAHVEQAELDLRDTARLTEVLQDYCQRHPVDLFIANAGVKTGNLKGLEPAAQLERVISVNLTATLHAVQMVLPQMLDRGRGQIALVSSLAAISPHADLLSYSATKAALVGYATALRRGVRKQGVQVSVILPGFIDTPMTHRQLGPTPLCVSPERAANVVVRGLARGKPTIAFPRLLIYLAWLAEHLPSRLADALSDGYRAKIGEDADETRG